MTFLVNDLSIHGQFHTSAAFFASVETLMAIRRAIRTSGRELFCHRGLKNALVMPNRTMPEVIQEMPRDKRQAWTHWVSREGPHWDIQRQHSSDDWLEAGGEPIFTDRAIGEAAYCILNGLHRELISIDPSDWLRSPILVTWRRSDISTADVSVANHWSLDTVAASLNALPPPFESWETLEECARKSLEKLHISDNAFERLKGVPYVRTVGEGIFALLQVLNKLHGGYDEDGNQTSEYKSLYDTYFKGHAPYFTDESEPNKRSFKSQLTFSHPDNPGSFLFCPWHGKVSSPKNMSPTRIHFTWPVTASDTLFVVYLGPKLTME